MAALGIYGNWFDLVTLVAVGVGINIGRKRGMSEELLDAGKWVAIVLIAGLFYESPGAALSSYMKMRPTYGWVFFYLLFAFAVWKVFAVIKKLTGDKLFGRDTFGNMEYPLGMLAGGLRALCIMIVVISLLNSIYVSEEDLERDARAQRESFGAISFPTIGSVRQQVFFGSVTGRHAKAYIDRLLVMPSPPYTREHVKLEGIHKERDDLVNQATDKAADK